MPSTLPTALALSDRALSDRGGRRRLVAAAAVVLTLVTTTLAILPTLAY